VTAAVLAAGTELVVVGRAGIGLDNVDVAAATERGVMVVNAPQSNILSAAEQAMALLLAQARNIPQAHAALVAGKWERSKWEGVELHGKTLGVVGLGRVGALVASACGSSPTTRSCRPTGPGTWVSSSWTSTRSSVRPTS
jgi:D-3-phosphoglycerate dehydrogenase